MKSRAQIPTESDQKEKKIARPENAKNENSGFWFFWIHQKILKLNKTYFLIV